MKQKCKKLLSVVLTIVMFFSITTGIDLSAYAAGNSISNATSISFNSKYNGYITSNNTKDVYKFSMSSSGKINLNVEANISASTYYLYDANGNILWDGDGYRWNENTQLMTFTKEFDLTKGTYYFSVNDYYGSTGNYSFKVTFTSSNESFSEPQGGNNNSIATANEIAFGNTYKGQLAINDNTDLYKFSLSSSGRITISVKANIPSSTYYIYDKNGNTLWDGECYRWNDNTKLMTFDQELDLTKGTYYFSVRDYYGTTGNYSFNIHTHTYNSYTTNATATSDGKIVKKCSVCGKVGSTTVIPRISSVTLSTSSYVYNGKVKTPAVTAKDRTGKTLVKNTDYTVSYANERKYVGKYAVKVTFKGNYSGTKTLYFTINPKGTTISSVSALSKGFKVSWKKQTTQTTGYQIQYSTSSKFTNAKTVTVSKNSTTSKSISKLSAKKKYYVRVRTYKTVNGTKYYSSWSGYKSVTTKK